MMAVSSCYCEICLEEYSEGDGIKCGNNHFLCHHDLNPYLTENILPYVHKLRKNKCAVTCPVINCGCIYNPITIYEIMGTNEKARYLSIVKNVCESIPLIIRLRNTFQDILTLNCPTCKRPVDPYPDACSAVMCLNCGNYYCNYCFQGFATGNAEEDRAACHTHSALHHPSTDPTQRDAFLPHEVIKVGQLQRQRTQLIQCVALAMSSKEFATDNRINIALSLILLDLELRDLNTSISDVWTQAELFLLGQPLTEEAHSDMSHVETKEDNLTSSPPHLPHPPHPHHHHQFHPDLNPPLNQQIDASGSSQLANALTQQNSHAVRQILQAYRNEIDVNYVEPQHLYPLTSLAILSKQKDVALLLLRRGADPTLMSRQGRNVIFIVIEAGFLDLLMIIFEKHPHLDVNMSINSEGQNYTMLHTAVRFRQGHIIQWLTERPGINLNPVESEFQYTPIMLAIIKNSKWSIDVLLNAGADISIPARNGRTPLYVAVEKSQISTFQTLLTVCNVNTQFGINQPVCMTHGSCPLHVAVLHNKLEMLEFLLAAGAEVDRADHDGCTALYRALVHGHDAIALELLRAGANPNRSNTNGRTYLYIAIEKNLLNVVRVMLTEYHLPINNPTSLENIDCLPVSVALIYHSHEVLRLLVELGADLNCHETVDGHTPLMTAISLGDYWATKFLLQHNADPQLPISNGRRPLYIAIEKGNTEIIRLLLSHERVNIHDPVTNTGEKPLHVAVIWQQADAVSTLLDLGADELIQNMDGKTPLDLANELSSTSLLQIFHYYRQRR